MSQVIDEEFPLAFLFDDSITLVHRCPKCHSMDNFKIGLPGLEPSEVKFLDPLSSRYFDSETLQKFSKLFPNVMLIEKQTHSVVATCDTAVPTSEKLAISVFERICHNCNEKTLFHYNIGYGEREKGILEPNRLVIHARANEVID